MTPDAVIVVGVDLASEDGDRTVIVFAEGGRITGFEVGGIVDLKTVPDSGTAFGSHADLGLSYFYGEPPEVREIVAEAPRPWDAPRQDWLKGRKRRSRR